MDTAGRGVEATDVVHDARRIDERMLVRTGHLDPTIVVGDAMAARHAHERAVIIAYPIIHRFR
jgi:hypothetical protein